MREQSNSKWRRPLYPLRKPVFCGGVAVVEGAMVKRRWLSSATPSSASSACTQFTGKWNREFLGLLVSGFFGLSPLHPSIHPSIYAFHLFILFLWIFFCLCILNLWCFFFVLFLPFSIRWLSLFSFTLSITGFKLKSIT